MPLALVADDDAYARRIITVDLEACGYTVIQAKSWESALAACRGHVLTLAVLDIELRQTDQVGIDMMQTTNRGFALGHALIVQFPRLPIIFMSGHSNRKDSFDQFRLAYPQHGLAYMVKDSEDKVALRDIVHRVENGEQYIDSTALAFNWESALSFLFSTGEYDQNLYKNVKHAYECFDQLTSQQQDVAILLTQALPIKAMADILHIVKSTVDDHIGEIKSQLLLSDENDLVTSKLEIRVVLAYVLNLRHLMNQPDLTLSQPLPVAPSKQPVSKKRK